MRATCHHVEMHQRRLRAPLTVAALLVLTACGTASDDDAAATTSDAADQASATSTPGDFEPVESEPAVAQPDADQPDATQPEAEPAVTTPATAAPPATDATTTTAPPPVPEPVIGGRLLASAVQPAADFDNNPFPDLVVDDIGKDAQVNIRNILPSDRPVLLWAWAPH